MLPSSDSLIDLNYIYVFHSLLKRYEFFKGIIYCEILDSENIRFPMAYLLKFHHNSNYMAIDAILFKTLILKFSKQRYKLIEKF